MLKQITYHYNALIVVQSPVTVKFIANMNGHANFFNIIVNRLVKYCKNKKTTAGKKLR